MSSADLFEDGYPHGTVEGFLGGCRGGSCPAGVEHGLSCKRAKMLAAGDYRYPKLVAQGLTPAEIAAALKEAPHTPPSAPDRPDRPRDPFTTSHPKAKPAQPPAPAAPEPEPQPEEAAMDAEPTQPTKHDDIPESAVPPIDPPGPITTDRWTSGLTVKAKTQKLREIREWCRANGFPGVPVMGKIPQDALRAYDAAQNQVVVTALQPRPIPGGLLAVIKATREQPHATEGAPSSEPTETGSALADDDHGDEPVSHVPEIPAHKRCPEKVRFDTHEDAEQVREKIEAKAAAKGEERAPLRSYQCPFCDGWHHTSQPLKNHKQRTPRPLTTAIADVLPDGVRAALEAPEPETTAADFTDILDETHARVDEPTGGITQYMSDRVTEFAVVGGDSDEPEKFLPPGGSDRSNAILAETLERLKGQPAPEPTDRPDWADVTIPESVEQARSIAQRLEEENAQLLEQIAALTAERDTAHSALEFALRAWDYERRMHEAGHDLIALQERDIRHLDASLRLLDAMHTDAARIIRDQRRLIDEHITKPWWKRARR